MKYGHMSDFKFGLSNVQCQNVQASARGLGIGGKE